MPGRSWLANFYSVGIIFVGGTCISGDGSANSTLTKAVRVHCYHLVPLGMWSLHLSVEIIPDVTSSLHKVSSGYLTYNCWSILTFMMLIIMSNFPEHFLNACVLNPLFLITSLKVKRTSSIKPARWDSVLIALELLQRKENGAQSCCQLQESKTTPGRTT